MSTMPILTQLPRAYVLASSFPAATAPSAQGISRPPSPTTPSALESQSPADSRSPSPAFAQRDISTSPAINRQVSYPPFPSADSSRASSWRPSSRSTSRSKDPLFKRVERAGKPAGKPLFSWLRASQVEEEEDRGRQLGDARSITSNQASRESGSANGTMSRERAQMVIAFCLIGLVGMNDSATGANVSSDI
ncbi:hypothetical protein P7C70_g1288, partial [Phenoliferia sp. Uapishka_3]